MKLDRRLSEIRLKDMQLNDMQLKKPYSSGMSLKRHAACVLVFAFPFVFQLISAPAAWAQVAQPSDARRALIERARSLDARNMADLAAQSWAQVLLSDPSNTEALAGAARDYKLTGNLAQSNTYLDRLRRVNPNDPNIAKINSAVPQQLRDERMKQAAQLAAQGNPDDAVRIYHSVFGNHPPDGDVALGYYQTLYATASGKSEALAGLRGLYLRYPGNIRYAVALGRTLTYNAASRDEGVRILRQYPKDSEASNALRQALIWGGTNANTTAEMRAYLGEHPGDTELAGKLKQSEAVEARPKTGLVRTPAEQAAYGALNAKHLEDAERRFQEILTAEPENGRADAGLGFVMMQRNRFADAVSYLERAQKNGVREKSVDSALDTARFWNVMAQANDAAGKGQDEVARERYKAALAMRPSSKDALNGAAGLLVREEEYGQAAEIYQQLVKADAKDTAAWRGLFLAEARDAEAAQALDTAAKFPAGVKASLTKDPEYLQALVGAYRAVGDDAAAGRTLQQALALPFPDNGRGMKTDARLQYASLLSEGGRWGQAATIYSQVLVEEPGNLSAWQGLVSALHGAGQDEEAVATVEKMPPATYEQALANPGFLSMLGSIYQGERQYDIAQSFLERAQKLAGGKTTIPMQLQLAAIDAARGNSAQAYDIYRQILTAHPTNTDAWKGLLSTLQANSRAEQALEQMEQIPADVRGKLNADVEYQRILANLYASVSDYRLAVEWNNRVQAHYRGASFVPADVEIQNAWLLFNIQSDRALYPALMKLGARTDLTLAQRKTVQTIWADWSVRRAGAAVDTGNQARALLILNTALAAFPDSLEVRIAIAGGYVKAQQPKMAVAIFRDIDLSHASSSEYQTAISAALGADARVQAEQWLRQALAVYSKDPAILGMAARYEQARGDDKRAAAYWRASLAVMPQVSPTDRLAHVMVQPDGTTRRIHPSTPAELARILDPENEPYNRTVTLAPLPSYGPDPYQGGGVPVVISPRMAQIPVQEDVPSQASPVDEGAPMQKKRAQPLPPPSAYTPQAAGSESAGSAVSADVDVAAITAAVAEATRNASEAALPEDAADAVVADVQPPVDAEVQIAQSREAEVAATVAEGVTLGMQSIPEPARPVVQIADASVVPAPAMAIPVESAAPETVEDSTVLRSAQYTPSATELQKDQPQVTKKKKATKAHRITATPQPESQEDTVASPIASPIGGTTRQRSASLPDPSEVAALGREQAYDVQLQQGLSDQQLQEQSLPPLRGPWEYVRRAQAPLTPRDEAEQQLMRIEGAYSPWLAGMGVVNHRSGNAGFDSLTTLTADFEASIPIADTGRLTFIARPVFLDSGTADGTATIRSTSGNIPEPLGTVLDTDTDIPAQQNAAGVGGEVQLAFPTISGAVGYSSSGFLVSTITGRFRWQPGNGHFTINGVRDVVKDTQLSYAGLRDPGSATLVSSGNIWGGVVSNGGTVQYTQGDANSGFYVSAGGQRLYGIHVRDNNRFEGGAGAYWHLWGSPYYGDLTVGANFFGMHYSNNDRAFTYGMGGYFSPQAYVLANVPVTWTGQSGPRLHYSVLGSFGVQGFQEDKEPFFPLDPSIQLANSSPYLPAQTVVGSNFDLRGQIAYLLHNHWFLGGFLSANNSRDYVSGSVGFSVHYVFRSQPEMQTGPPTGMFPTDGLRPVRVP